MVCTSGLFWFIETQNKIPNKITINEKDLTEKNTEFRIKWPRGSTWITSRGLRTVHAYRRSVQDNVEKCNRTH